MSKLRAKSLSFLFMSALLFGSATLSGCAAGGEFVWVQDVPMNEKDGPDYRIRDSDTVAVRVFGQDNFSGQDKVRPDGKISLPFVGDVVAINRKPIELAADVEDRLKSALTAPKVSVTIAQTTPISVSVVGEVRNPGIYQLDPAANVLTAVASGGGLSDYADSDRIFVVRRNTTRVRFRYDDLRAGLPKPLKYGLKNGDVVVVE